eukprot:m.3505 g.3505  ORF g.3505 m.3505 type:complete len:81 (+) comp9494_c0_seq1:158-400(+)
MFSDAHSSVASDGHSPLPPSIKQKTLRPSPHLYIRIGLASQPRPPPFCKQLIYTVTHLPSFGRLCLFKQLLFKRQERNRR